MVCRLKRCYEGSAFNVYTDNTDSDCLDFLPNAKEIQMITLAKEMADIQSVTMKLQEFNINLYDVRVLFGGLISRFSKVEKYVSKSSKIIENKDVENGVVGAING